MFQLRVSFEKDVKKQEAMWERQHEVAAEKIYNMCTDLGGFFLKVFVSYFLQLFGITFELINCLLSFNSCSSTIFRMHFEFQ